MVQLDDSNSTRRSKECHVLVTGAGPFKQTPINPSNIVARGLPSRIPVSSLGASTSTNIDIIIHPTPEPWSVSYSWVNEHVPSMLFPPQTGSILEAFITEPIEPSPNYDFVLFIGVAPGRNFYTFETQAFRDDYSLPDNDGENALKDYHWKQQGAPKTLTTSFRTDEVYQNCRRNISEKIDVRKWYNPGRYLCGYIYYTGLYEYWLRGNKSLASERPVVFLHMPSEHDPVSIQNGIVVATNLIKALAIDLHQTRDNNA